MRRQNTGMARSYAGRVRQTQQGRRNRPTALPVFACPASIRTQAPMVVTVLNALLVWNRMCVVRALAFFLS
jgi:hypothetical protein